MYTCLRMHPCPVQCKCALSHHIHLLYIVFTLLNQPLCEMKYNAEKNHHSRDRTANLKAFSAHIHIYVCKEICMCVCVCMHVSKYPNGINRNFRSK